VVPRRRSAHHHRYQHATSRRAVAELPWWGTSAVSHTLALTSGTEHIIGSMHSKSRYDRFVG
jgi:hypothetical protein